MNELQYLLTLLTAASTTNALGKMEMCIALLSLSFCLPRYATSHSMETHLLYSFLLSQENLMPNAASMVHLPKKEQRKMKKLSSTKV